MTVASRVASASDALREKGCHLLERELQILGVSSPIDLFVVNALSSCLIATVRMPHERRRRLTFEEGALLRDEEATPLGEADITLTFWPDMALLDCGAVAFDHDHDRVAERIHAVSAAHPAISIDIVDARQAT